MSSLSRWARQSRPVFTVYMPTVPFVLFARIARRVLQTPGYLGAFVSSLPPLLGFILAWSAGELLGYLSAPVSGREVADRDGASA